MHLDHIIVNGENHIVTNQTMHIRTCCNFLTTDIIKRTNFMLEPKHTDKRCWFNPPLASIIRKPFDFGNSENLKT